MTTPPTAGWIRILNSFSRHVPINHPVNVGSLGDYAIVAAEESIADAQEKYPGVAHHLRQCTTCADIVTTLTRHLMGTGERQ